MQVQIVKQWEVEAIEPVVAIAPDGTWAVVSNGGVAELLELPWGVSLGRTANYEAEISALAVSADGRLVAAGYSCGEVRLWEVPELRLRPVLSAHHLRIMSLAFAGADRLLSACWDRTCRIWDTNTGECEACLAGHTDVVTGVAYASSIAATAGRDGTLRCWRRDDGWRSSGVCELGGMARAVALSEAGDCIAVGHSSGQLRIDRQGTVNTLHLPEAVTALKLSKDGRRVYAGLAGGDLWWRGDLIPLVGPMPSRLAAGLSLDISADERWGIGAAWGRVVILRGECGQGA